MGKESKFKAYGFIDGPDMPQKVKVNKITQPETKQKPKTSVPYDQEAVEMALNGLDHECRGKMTDDLYQ